MRVVCLKDAASGRRLLERVEVAERPLARLMGLMGRAGLEPGAGMFFPRCTSIHMFFMRFAIDAVYVDRDLKVRRVMSALRPWRLSWCPGAWGVLEAPAGWAAGAGLRPGMQIAFEETPETTA